jgi:thymidylate kinase
MMAARGETIALEGVCCAGKTTLVRQLSSHLEAGVIPELPEFGRNLFRPFTNGEAILYNGRKSIAIEKVRMMGANALSKIAGYAILDRSVLSTLALGYGAIDLIGTSGYQELAEEVLSEVHTGELPFPDKTLYISVDGATVQKRNETRIPRLDDYWVNPERIERQNEFYRSLSRVAGVELINGAREHREVLTDVIEQSVNAPMASSSDMALAIEEFSDNFSY